MPTINELPTPALLIDADVLDRNLERMAARGRALGIRLRPHIKTHKCVEIATAQRKHGAVGITVSTLYEARVFADHGFEDITWAFPLVLTRIDEAVALSQRITLRVVVDSAEAVSALISAGAPMRVLLKVDCGYHRAGVDPDAEESLEFAYRIAAANNLTFDGILSHSGHAYDGTSDAAIAEIAERERCVMVEFADRLRGRGVEVPVISVGSTPSMTRVRSLDGVTEARPGNYALFDYSQVRLGSCTPADCAATVFTSVVSSHPAPRHAIVDAGALALSKDTGPDPDTMGRIYADYGAGTLRDDLRVVAVSQEHGHVDGSPPVGTRLRILPNHSCLTVAQFAEAHVVSGAEVVGTWRIWNAR